VLVRLADHLRETNRKLVTFSQVSKALQQELDAAHAVNKRLIEQISILVHKTPDSPAAPQPTPPPN
jgi:hypothetical protein